MYTALQYFTPYNLIHNNNSNKINDNPNNIHINLKLIATENVLIQIHSILPSTFKENKSKNICRKLKTKISKFLWIFTKGR